MSEKIQKIIARAGLASRRAAEDLLRQHKVTVNGEVAKLGDRAELTDTIAVNGKELPSTEVESVVLMYHKPEGELCSHSDPDGRPLIFDNLPPCPQGKWLYVGRLDVNSSGLLLVTNNGEYANKLMHPRNHVQRTYLVRAIGEIAAEDIMRLQNGIELEDGKAKFTDFKERPGTSRGKNRWYEVSIGQGRNRIVRRMFEAVNCSVSRLVRIKIGKLLLPRDLAPGESRELTKKQLQLLGLEK